jgi:TPR repeat protein
MWGSEQEKREFGALYLFFYGHAEERNYAKAIKSIKKLAEGGYVPAICTLGLAYYDHKGVRKNLKTAFELFLWAAKAGYPTAEGAVGNFYVTAYPKHDACEIDPEKAVQWYLLAAEHGNAGSQCNLAKHYLKGYGVEQDPGEAYIWSSLAVHCSTIRFRIAEVFRDQAIVLLTDEARKKAEQRIEEMQGRLPYEWSEHMTYWRKLYQNA